MDNLCYECGMITSLSIRVEDLQLNNITFSAEMKWNLCSYCGAGSVHAIDLKQWEEDICEQIIKVDNPTEDMIRFVRKTYGVSKEVFNWLVKNAVRET